MKLPRIIRQIGKRFVEATPVLRRHILTSTDYRVLGGIDEARSMTASSAGWLAARTVMRQERAYQGLIAAMKAVSRGSTSRSRQKPSRDRDRASQGGRGRLRQRLLFGSVSHAPSRGVRYTGIDYSDAMIARARTHYPSTALRSPTRPGCLTRTAPSTSSSTAYRSCISSTIRERSARPPASRHITVSFNRAGV